MLGSDEIEDVGQSEDILFWKKKAQQLQVVVNKFEDEKKKNVTKQMRTSEMIMHNTKITQRIDRKLFVQKANALSMLHKISYMSHFTMHNISYR